MRTILRTPLLALAVAAVATHAHGDSAVQFMTAKSLPEATVDVIDPESGTSTGTVGSDVNLAAGDIILFRFSVGSAPASAVRGIQSYLTEYVPPGTEVVGARLVDANGYTVPPRRAGLALDGCAGGSLCKSVGGFGSGSIAELHADTGIFFSTDPITSPIPDSAFLSLDNGILMDPEPRAIDPEIVQLLNDTSGTYFAHSDWDWDQVLGFGTQGSAFTDGRGNTPHGYGSPVAGPDTHYPYEVTDAAGDDVLSLGDVIGPWERVYYPGSHTGVGTGGGSTSVMARVGVDTVAGYDLTPATAVPATAVRFAMGEAHVGEIRYVEVALRVHQVPIDPSFGGAGGNVDCGEVFGSDISSKAANTGGANNPWPTFVPHPQCVFLRLKFDLEVDRALAAGGDLLEYRVFAKNLSVAPETGATVVVKYVESDQDYVGATPPPDATATCPAPETNRTCLTWNLGTLAPSDEVAIDVDLRVAGIGGGTNVVLATYDSNELSALDPAGYTTTAMTVVQSVAAPVITADNTLTVTSAFASPNTSTWAIDGAIQNAGTASWTQEDLTIELPSGWRVINPITIGTTTYGCAGTGCSTSNVQTFPAALTYAPLGARTFSFRVHVPTGTATGVYPVTLRTRGNQGTFGSFETEFYQAVEIPVGAVRSLPPVLDCPILSTETSIRGTAEAGAAIDVLFNLIERGDGVADGVGAWTVANFGAFGGMYGGLEVRAIAQAAGELPSVPSDACFVTPARECGDGLDNDGDGLVDFPADPGCDSLSDPSETNPPAPACRDGIDNDGAGGADWPDDPSCTDPDDPTEDGVPACADGVDNDGDGLVDFPADTDCTSLGDGTEVRYRACQDGADDDGDGLVDFPDDPGCHSDFDDDEFDAGSSPLDTKARLLLAVDSSGSMNWNTCADEFTGGDGSTECPGADVACTACGEATCDNAEPDDSRLFQVKAGLSNVVAAFGEVEYALMRFHQRAMGFECPGLAAAQQSGGWQGGGAAPCGGGFAAGDLLVSFAQENEPTILDWINHDSDYDGVAPIGTDFEIRGSGTTPLAGILESAGTYLDEVRADDLRVACRPYRVVLVTDGAETCGGDPGAAAAALFGDGIAVHVIGFATPDPTVIANLDAIAVAGGTGGAIFVDDEAALSAAIAQIIEESILIETCNGADDDCDGTADEDFPDLGDACDNGEEGACFEPGVRVCTANGQGTRCDAPDGVPGTEVCNGLDDDCDSLVDENLGGTCTCDPVPEICNGLDDDCDSAIDEGTLPGVGDSCGPDVGVCDPGTLACVGGALECVDAIGPGTEVCDAEDDDCDTFVDEVSSVCYEFPSGCTEAGGAWSCAGVCRTGVRGCVAGADGPCVGDVGPGAELCNGLDDDCDGTVDDGFDVGGACDNGELGACLATGVLVCDGAGGVVCTAPDVIPGTESCNNLDDDCDGAVDEALGAPIGEPCGGGGACSVGVFECVDGAVVCVGNETGTVEACNAADDDCDTVVDEDVPGTGGDCVPTGFEPYQDTGACEFGHLECIGGVMDCRDYVGPQPDVPCNGIDEDCDGSDSVVCPVGQACVEEACRAQCGPGEFPCPFGFQCSDVQPDGLRYCIPDPCAEVVCEPGEQCDSDTGECLDLCEGVTCTVPGAECVAGVCRDCFTLGCDGADEVCVLDPGAGGGVCVVDACAAAECPDDQFCRDGACVALTCEPRCPDGERCLDGACVDDPCDGPCPDGQVCDPEEDTCVLDRCDGVACGRGEACNPYTGECVPDPCVLIDCPAGSRCAVTPDGGGTCEVPPAAAEISAAGGGGCAAGGDGAGAGGIALLALAVGGLRRRRSRAAA